MCICFPILNNYTFLTYCIAFNVFCCTFDKSTSEKLSQSPKQNSKEWSFLCSLLRKLSIILRCMFSARKYARAGQIVIVKREFYARTIFDVKWHIHTHVEYVDDMLIQMSEYSLMWGYLFVRCCTVILYDTIVGKYVMSYTLPFLSILLLFST